MVDNGDELAFMSATEQAALIRGRRVSPVELIELYLRRIEWLDPTLNCFVLVTAEKALEQAKAAEDAVVRQRELPTISRCTRLDQGHPVHRRGADYQRITGVRPRRARCR